MHPMKLLINKYLLIIFLTLVFYSAKAQDYNFGISFREVWDHGFGSGVDFKFFLGKKTPKNNQAIDIIVHTLWRGIMFTNMYEVHNPLYLFSKSKGLYWYFGAGFHMGNFIPKEGFCPEKLDALDRITKIGIDGVIGLEYELDRVSKHTKLPLIIGVDFKPYYDIYGAGCGGNWLISASIGVVFLNLRGVKMILK